MWLCNWGGPAMYFLIHVSKVCMNVWLFAAFRAGSCKKRNAISLLLLWKCSCFLSVKAAYCTQLEQTTIWQAGTGTCPYVTLVIYTNFSDWLRVWTFFAFCESTFPFFFRSAFLYARVHMRYSNTRVLTIVCTFVELPERFLGRAIVNYTWNTKFYHIFDCASVICTRFSI